MSKFSWFYLIGIISLLGLWFIGIKRQPLTSNQSAITTLLLQEIKNQQVFPSRKVFFPSTSLAKETIEWSAGQVYHLCLGEKAKMQDALTWLKQHFPDKEFVLKHFSYGLYNYTDAEKMISFEDRLREPLPAGFLLAYLKGGTRIGASNIYTLNQLINQNKHQSTLYLFWKKDPLQANPFPFSPDNYHLEINYDQGTHFGGNSYIAINQIIFRHKHNQEVIASYPMNIKIEEPFVIFNYDFQLRFPFYNYQKEGVLWDTNHIKSLRKIELYEKRTGQSRTLYYDVE
ncbi:hypothetical protein [Candidatus Phytoplasma oryzae]|nr:hypothetical protein PIE28_01940 [Candidatus Phytoplasma oryzae]